MNGPGGDSPRPAGRADATGPLPVAVPADGTGPMPVTPATPASQAPEPTDATGPQPLLDGPQDPTDAVGSAAEGTTAPDTPTGPVPEAPSWFAEAQPVDTSGAGVAIPVEQVEAPAAPTAAPPPATGLFEAVALPHADTGDSSPATSLFEPATPPPNGSAPATGLFDTVASAPADTSAPPATGLFEPATPHRTDTGAPPATNLFEAVDPAGAPPTGAAPPPIVPVEATRPIPAVGTAAPTGNDPGSAGAGAAAPGTTALPLVGSDSQGHQTSLIPATRQPRTDAWSFGPDSGGLPRPEQAGANAGDGGRTRATASATAVPAPAVRSTGSGRRRTTWPLTLLGVLVAIAGGVALVLSFAPTAPDDLVTAAAEDLRNWNGVHYQGAIAALDGGEIQIDLTVTADGASGKLTRNGGQAVAELLWDESGTLLRANREWWLYHHGAKADELADTWVADPLTETQEIDPILALHPAALAQHIRPEKPAVPWEAVEQLIVGGRRATMLSDGARRLVVGSDPNRLLALDVVPTERGAPLQVTDVPADQAGAVAGRAGAVRNAESPKTLTQRLRERPRVEIKIKPEPLCVTETCGVTVTVTNSGTLPARGHLEISADGRVVATHPMDVHPGQVAEFTATAPNPHFTDPGATGEILWESRAVDG